jgi:hypothetical protein
MLAFLITKPVPTPLNIMNSWELCREWTLFRSLLNSEGI